MQLRYLVSIRSCNPQFLPEKPDALQQSVKRANLVFVSLKRIEWFQCFISFYLICLFGCLFVFIRSTSVTPVTRDHFCSVNATFEENYISYAAIPPNTMQ